MVDPVTRTNPERQRPTGWWPRALRWGAYVVIAVFAYQWFAGSGGGPRTDTTAPEFALPVVGDSGQFSLASARGKPVVVEVFASWCSACRSNAPVFSEVSRAERKRDVHFLGISLDESPRAALAAKTEWQLPYPVLSDRDGKFARAYGITRLPTFVLIDADGIVREVHSGPARKAELEGWLEKQGAARL